MHAEFLSMSCLGFGSLWFFRIFVPYHLRPASLEVAKAYSVLPSSIWRECSKCWCRHHHPSLALKTPLFRLWLNTRERHRMKQVDDICTVLIRCHEFRVSSADEGACSEPSRTKGGVAPRLSRDSDLSLLYSPLEASQAFTGARHPKMNMS